MFPEGNIIKWVFFIGSFDYGLNQYFIASCQIIKILSYCRENVCMVVWNAKTLSIVIIPVSYWHYALPFNSKCWNRNISRELSRYLIKTCLVRKLNRQIYICVSRLEFVTKNKHLSIQLNSHKRNCFSPLNPCLSVKLSPLYNKILPWLPHST